MPTRTDPAAPRSPALRLRDLDDADRLDFADGRSQEALSFAALDLSDVELADAAFRECLFDDVDLTGGVLRGLRLIECELRGARAADLQAPRSTWRDVALSGSRVGSLELYDSTLDAVSVGTSKLGYVNLRDARLTDVAFEGCTVDTLDLMGAMATRVRFVDCTVDELDLTGATLAHVDLRGLRMSRITGIRQLAGSTIGEDQLAELAPLLADDLGIRIA